MSRGRRRKPTANSEIRRLNKVQEKNTGFQNFIISALEYHGLVYRDKDEWKIKKREDDKD